MDLRKILREASEHASVLPSMKQNVPSDREERTEGVGERNWGKKPSIISSIATGGQHGDFDTQGKGGPTMFPSHQGFSKSNEPGTYTPKTYKRQIGLSENSTLDAAATKHDTGVTSMKVKTGGIESNTRRSHCPKKTSGAQTKPINEEQLVGSALALAALQLFNGS